MSDRPLLICDADEVLLQLSKTLVTYLDRRDIVLDLKSYSLVGNMHHHDGRPVTRDELGPILDDFFEAEVENIPLFPGAAEALEELSGVADVVILTNVPAVQRERRETSLHALGCKYPVYSNEGGKGRRVAEMMRARRSPGAFVDDTPEQHRSVARHAPDVHRVQLVSDPHIWSIIPRADDAHAHFSGWETAVPHLMQHLRS